MVSLLQTGRLVVVRFCGVLAQMRRASSHVGKLPIKFLIFMRGGISIENDCLKKNYGNKYRCPKVPYLLFFPPTLKLLSGVPC